MGTLCREAEKYVACASLADYERVLYIRVTATPYRAKEIFDLADLSATQAVIAGSGGHHWESRPTFDYQGYVSPMRKETEPAQNRPSWRE